MGLLKDGHGTRITFSVNGTLYGEVEVTPPEVDGRGGIDMTSMRNAAWTTMAPKSLKSLNAMNARIIFDTAMYQQAFNLINKNRGQVVTFPDNSSLSFWGWWNKFSPEGMSTDNRPTAGIEVQPSNLNQDCVESGPTYSAGSPATCA